MNAELQAYQDKIDEKRGHKNAMLVALGQAKLAEQEGRQADADAAWAIVVSRGMGGDEGKCHDALQEMADAYVDAHPEQFAAFEQYANPEGKDKLVQLIASLGKAGLKEEALKLIIFERSRFERVKVAPAVQMRTRIGKGGKG
jgi:hypothetical protein